MNYFVFGDVVTCVRDIKFMDNTEHKAGNQYTVDDSTVPYFHVNHKDYVLVNDSCEKAKEDSKITTLEYKKDLFRSFFTTPFDQYKERVGQRFSVVGHDTASESELENFEDMYLIEFEDGEKITAWGHEVCRLNYQNCS